jgi:hypothetical protein
MKNKKLFPVFIWVYFSAFLLTFSITGCSTVKLVGDYDEQIDKGITLLQKEVETFLVKLEATAVKPSDTVESYDKNKQFYDNAKVEISSLRVRADAIERNSITVRMLDRLSNSIFRLEQMHREGIKKDEIDQSIRGALNSEFTAILTFELAKKRGKKITDAKALSPATQK